ncbi:PfWMP4_13 [Phormidium phage Pf-WMP4]|uniref:PfWMP4_13 n=1 Tax=Phormidium phage Pf-WMP4 TaxID=2913979 RepID=Q0GBV3_9CAUD|nr:PfWMP4_13 [Phormidium phage Pf-WMP4]ABI33157.1 PfWMP4_13 [Phormidium phage Pf-WMP4]
MKLIAVKDGVKTELQGDVYTTLAEMSGKSRQYWKQQLFSLAYQTLSIEVEIQL